MAEDIEKTAESHWKCGECGYTLKAERPPNECPACNKQCIFLDVTSYTPEGGFGGTDTRLG